MQDWVQLFVHCDRISYVSARLCWRTHVAGAAAVVAGLFDCSVLDFNGFRYGDTAAAGEVEEKGCEQEGLRLDKERTAPEEGLKGIIFEAMVVSGRREGYQRIRSLRMRWF